MLYQIFFVFAAVHLCAGRNINYESPHLRIIGGNESVANILPPMVYIEIDPHDADPDIIEACGGSLLTTQHVLTAAHCVEPPNTINFILVGAHNISKKEKTQQKVYSEKFIMHKDYENPENANDIAIIKLKTPVTLNNNVKLITLPTARDVNKTYVGVNAIAYGWGLIHDEPTPVETDVLMTVNLKVISLADCLKQAPDKDVYGGDLCTAGTGTKGTCSGDSGGPLMYNGVQIGVTSRGTTGHCERNDPSVYVRVTSYLTWIQDTLKKLN